MTRKIELALALAAYAHRDQRDKAGKDYFEHPKTVAANFGEENRIIVALLHDVLEDTDVTPETIGNLFGQEILDACLALTHKEGEEYLSYVRRALTNPIARDVKRADLMNNMDLSRLPEIDSNAIWRMEHKYIPAMKLLMDYEQQMTPVVKKIYFDMDDTIADFSLGLKEICSMEPVLQDQSTDEQDNAMWAAVRKAGDFYYRLKECAPGMELLRKLRVKYGDRVEILSAVPKAKRGIVSAEEDKRRWVAEHIDSSLIVNIVHSAEEKKAFIKGEGYFLVDDLAKNIDGWRNAGGVGIWFLKDDPQTTETEIDKSGLL